MTHCKKKRLIKFLELLIKTCDDVRNCYYRNISGGNNDTINLLTKCQEMAIEVGTSIDKSEGEGTETVKLLEEYCELLYETGKNINDSSFKIEKACKMLEKKLDKALVTIRYEIKSRKEVLFLPYKASMWDSLESVWNAAERDNTCDAYVVPIPYYNLNSDGTQGKVHYEIEEYPGNVSTISFKEYDITDRCPDIIYIHNPYDSCNKITSVFPEYYASELKKHTDLLIYIPYFICINEMVPKHFVVLPGTIFADKVILQSESVRDAYIKEYKKQMISQGFEHLCINLENKFLALGSPKIDKVLSTTREIITIPEEWKNILNKNNIEDKKVVLYNTTLQSLMDSPEKYLDKIEKSLEIFKKSQKVILLWRPHPLMEESIERMYPYLKNRYFEIITKFRNEGWGIYDVTADVNRAIALSDAYYGDLSSVVELYKATGKPIMIQKLEV